VQAGGGGGGGTWVWKRCILLCIRSVWVLVPILCECCVRVGSALSHAPPPPPPPPPTHTHTQ
jgi:hypothetical protein